ncbi:MAG: GAF domain-containing protein [Thermodesulfovibrionales bacterium]|nr:GAF domain-containing protein [Thermodesulfovibrionales bacterium]
MKRQQDNMCALCGELAKARGLNATLNILAKNITGIMDVKGSTIRLLDEKDQTLEIVAAYGMSRKYLKKGPVILKKHPVDQKVLRGKAVKTKNILKEPHVLYLEEAKREGIKSVLSVPLMAEKKAIGVVRVYTAEPHDFSAAEVARLKGLAFLGGILADRARIWDEMRALIKIAQTISSTLSLDEVLQMIVESTAKTLGLRGSSIRLLNEEKGTLEAMAAYGLSRAYLEKGPVKVAESPLDMECLKCRIISIHDIRKDKRLQYPDEIIKEGILALLSLPLIVRGKAIGVLRVYTSVPYTFSESEIDFLSALACQGAIAIENARLFEHIKTEYKDLTRDVWKWYDWGTHFPKI